MEAPFFCIYLLFIYYVYFYEQENIWYDIGTEQINAQF